MYDSGANLRAQAGARFLQLEEQSEALQAKIDEFRQRGGLWTGPDIHDYLGVDDAEEAIACSEEYGQWYNRKKACRTAAEIEAVQAEFTDLKRQWLDAAIEDIARKALVWEMKKWEEEDAA